MKIFWEAQRGEEYFYVNLDTDWIEVGSNRGSGATDSAGRCTHAEFLAGRWLDSVGNDMGSKMLAEIIASIEAMAARAIER